MLQSAIEHYERQQRLTAAALVAVQRRRRSDTLGIAQTVAAFQLAAARDALAAIVPMLDEQGIYDPLVGEVPVEAFAGTASDGRSLTGLIEQARSSDSLSLIVATQIQDMARAAAAVSIAGRRRVGYVRMLNPPSCSRCAVLAGKFYRFNDGFLRHPRCDCRHVPSIESFAGDLTTDPSAYFDSLSLAEQDRIFTKAGAESIRLGADISQVVNARRVTAGMQFAGVPATFRKYGNLYTTEGTTRRALAFQQQVGLRRNGQAQQRLMPETILASSTSREDAQRKLRLYGYIRDDAGAAAGRVRLNEARRVERNARARARRDAERTN